MIWWVGSSLYATAGIIAARLLAGHIAWWMANDQAHGVRAPEAADWFYGWFVAVFAVALWPLIVAVGISVFVIDHTLTPLRVGAERAGHKELRRQELAAAVERSDKLLKELQP